MKCVSCSEEVGELKVKFFLSTFLCAPCADSAQAFRDRAKSELGDMLATLDDTVQLGLRDPTISLRGKISEDTPHFSVAKQAVDLRILQHERARKSWQKNSPQVPTLSITTTSPPALGTGVPEPKSSTKRLVAG